MSVRLPILIWFVLKDLESNGVVLSKMPWCVAGVKVGW